MSDFDSDDEWDRAAKALEDLRLDEDIAESDIEETVVKDNDDKQQEKTESQSPQQQQPIPAKNNPSRAVEIFSRMLGKPKLSSPTSASGGNKFLVLLDMNGVLLCRSPDKLKGNARPFDCKVLKNFCYIREGAKELVSWLIACPTVELCFYTSMMKKSAGPLAEYVTGKEEFENVYLFDQPFNKKDPDGENSWSMMRDLPKIWSSRDTPAYNHSERTTIMIDDSYAKMREYPDNVLLIPEYTENIIECGEINDDKVLKTTIKFMGELVETWNMTSISCDSRRDMDIREMIRKMREKYIF